MPADRFSTINYRQKPQPTASPSSLWRERATETMSAHATQKPTAPTTTRAAQAGLLLAGTFGGATLCTVVFLSGILSPQNGSARQNQREDVIRQTVFEMEPPRVPAPAAAASIPTRVQPRAANTIPAGYRRLDSEDLASPLVPAVAAPLPAAADPVRAVAPIPVSTPVDYAARDRRIESLKQQINALDDQVRTVRNNPRDYRYLGYYVGSGNGGVNQPALQKYLDQLDQRRNALRREKWQLEGR